MMNDWDEGATGTRKDGETERRRGGEAEEDRLGDFGIGREFLNSANFTSTNHQINSSAHC